MPEFLRVEDFEPHVGKVFRFEEAGYALPLDRISRSRTPAPPDAPREPFVLIFRGERSPVMPEGRYRCVVDDATAFELHVSPIHTPEPSRQEYQAAFN